jgi:glycine/D-amino acid oxidase-like deaminating enzyme
MGGLPAIGPVPGAPGVLVAAGHEGSGLCLGPATAELVVAQLLGGSSSSGSSSSDSGDTDPPLLRAAKALAPSARLAAAGLVASRAAESA